VQQKRGAVRRERERREVAKVQRRRRGMQECARRTVVRVRGASRAIVSTQKMPETIFDVTPTRAPYV
jgi:hypothetical protein